MRSDLSHDRDAVGRLTTACPRRFQRARAKLGQRLVVNENGMLLSGRLTELSATSLTIGSHVIKPAPGLMIERDHGHTAV